MAHFAELDAHDVVTRVIVVSNNELLDENGVESEAKGISFCQSLYGADTKWVQTSYNASFRKNYAGVGYTYSGLLDAFVPIRPFPSWILNETLVIWEPPIPRPNDGNKYRWDEDSLSWVPL